MLTSKFRDNLQYAIEVHYNKMNNRDKLTTLEASNQPHKDSRLVYLSPGAKTRKLARQPPRLKQAETLSTPEIPSTHVTTAR